MNIEHKKHEEISKMIDEFINSKSQDIGDKLKSPEEMFEDYILMLDDIAALEVKQFLAMRKKKQPDQ